MVYIDNFRAPFRGMIMCHMIADTVEELHNMAILINVERKHFQDGSFPHYDISLSKKRLALENGAQAISCKELVVIINELRKGKLKD